MTKTPVLSEPITLDTPIERGSGDSRQVIDKIQLRKLLPRISMPPVHEAEIDAMDPGDLFALAGALTDFLLHSSARQDSPPT